MATLNTHRKLVTHEGARAARIGPLARLERSVLSCLLWEDEFYEDGQAIGERLADLVRQVPAEDAARVAIRAKQDMKLRHAPLLVARELMRTKEGRALARDVFPKVIVRPDDVTEFLALYWKGRPDEPLAKQVKRWLGASFRGFDEYQLAKYSGGKKSVTLRDALRITRPKPDGEAQAALWGRLVKGELATPDTWEVELSKGGDKTASWTRLLAENRLGGLALLRNLRNMTKAGVDPTLIRRAIRDLKPGRLLPINFLASARHNPAFEADLEARFFDCFAGRPTRKGSTIILVDVSGSMDVALSAKSELRRIDVACALAMIGRQMFEDLRVFTFSDRLVEVPNRRGFALRDAIVSSQPHSGTALGSAVNALPARDRLIVITDEQSRDPVPQVKGYLINVASNANGVGYGAWLHIDGWSDRVLDYIAAYEADDAPATS